MPVPCTLFQEVIHRLDASVDPRHVPAAARTRLALLVTGILAAQSAVLAKITAELDALALTAATPESLARRLRRTLNDPHLTLATCYLPVLRHVLDWAQLLRGSQQVVLALDDSAKTDQIHLLRLSLTYWGGSLPLAWALWEQNVAQPAGHYWQQVEQLFQQVQPVIPAGARVVLSADRAFAVPALFACCQQYGWHWVVRVTTTGSHRFRDQRGRERALQTVLRQHLAQPGQRWKTRGWMFKKAGWCPVSLVGLWAMGSQDALVVLSDLPVQWTLLRLYERRFWIEPGFRNDKTRGWQWEASQVQGVAHHHVLVLALAWASLVTLCVGVASAHARLAHEQQRRATGCQGQPRRARESIFTLGLRALRRWLYHTTQAPLPWRLPDLDALSWEQHWRQRQSFWLLWPPSLPARPNSCAVRP